MPFGAGLVFDFMLAYALSSFEPDAGKKRGKWGIGS